MKSLSFLLYSTVFLLFSVSCVSKDKFNIPLKIDKEIEDGSGQFFMDCELDGFQTSCHIDTGANGNSIVLNDHTRQIPSQGRSKEKTASGHEAVCDDITVKTVKSGTHIIKQNVSFSRCQGKTKSVIGFPFFGKHTVHFNFLDSSIEFLQNTDSTPTWQKHHQTSREPYGHISLPITLGGNTKVKALWDTGAGLTGCSRKLISNSPSMFKFKRKIKDGVDPYGKPVSMELYLVKNLEVGGTTFREVEIIAMDFKPIRPYFSDGLECFLGFNTISKANWKFDFTNNLFSVNK